MGTTYKKISHQGDVVIRFKAEGMDKEAIKGILIAAGIAAFCLAVWFGIYYSIFMA